MDLIHKILLRIKLAIRQFDAFSYLTVLFNNVCVKKQNTSVLLFKNLHCQAYYANEHLFNEEKQTIVFGHSKNYNMFLLYGCILTLLIINNNFKK